MHDCVSTDTVLKYSVRGQLSGLRQTPIRDLKPVNIYLFHPFEVIRQSRLMASQAGQGLADRVSGGLHGKQCGPNQCPNLCLWTRLTPKTTGLGPGDFGLLGRFRENWQQTGYTKYAMIHSLYALQSDTGIISLCIRHGQGDIFSKI